MEPEHPNGQWSVENGELLITAHGNWCYANLLTIGDDTWEDYEIEFRFKIDQTFLPPDCVNSYGVMGAFVHLQLGYASRGVYLGPHAFVADGIWEMNFSGTIAGTSFLGVGDSFSVIGEVLSEEAELKEGTWYTVRIIAGRNQYEWFIDDQLMWQFEGESPQLAYGGVGLYTRNCDARFDDVTITGDTIPNMDMVTATLPGGKLTTTWGQIKDFWPAGNEGK
jgi:hypothetical protein